jgi:uncharacterized protein (UPF0548 family)
MGHARGLLVGRRLEQLRAADLTYVEVGSTRGELPPDYRHLRRQAVLGTGTSRFEEAAHALCHWDMHRRAGIRVLPSNRSVAEGVVAVQRLGVWKAAVEAPVRVVYVVDEPRRRGFAYGTLPGHPESGEESFVIELCDDDSVVLTITAFSRPAWRVVQVTDPIARAVQSWVTNRYLRSLQP